MEKNGWKRKESKQICVYKGKESLLEFENCMRPPSHWYPWHLHADGQEDEGKPSLIRMVMVNYSDRKNSVSVYANLRPKEVKWLYHQIFMMVRNASFSQQKIFREDKRSDRGKVTYLAINRYEEDSQGRKRNLPWRIEIQNGTGTVARNSLGGQYCKKDSYRKEKAVTVNLSDADAFMLFGEVVTVIRACEREHLFHRRDVENLGKLLKQLKQILGLAGKKEDDIAA